MTFDPADLTREKTLLQIRREARKIPSSPFNQWCVGITTLVALAYSFLPTSTADILAGKTREFAETGFGFAIGILGFLIAGFTVFATITKEELFIRMAAVTEPTSKLSYLKYNFFSFMRVFIDYLCFCGFCLLIKFLAFPGGPIPAILVYLPHTDSTKLWLSRIGFVLISASLAYVLLLLKAFVFNIHHVVMTSLRWAMENAEDEEH